VSAPLVGIGGWCAGGRMHCVRGGSADGPARSSLLRAVRPWPRGWRLRCPSACAVTRCVPMCGRVFLVFFWCGVLLNLFWGGKSATVPQRAGWAVSWGC